MFRGACATSNLRQVVCSYFSRIVLAVDAVSRTFPTRRLRLSFPLGEERTCRHRQLDLLSSPQTPICFLPSTLTRRTLVYIARGARRLALSQRDDVDTQRSSMWPKLTWASWRKLLPAGVRRNVVPPRPPLMLEKATASKSLYAQEGAWKKKKEKKSKTRTRRSGRLLTRNDQAIDRIADQSLHPYNRCSACLEM